MTPAARHSAAIEILDLYLGGEPAEKTLTSWARRNRYAGSGDRAAIRDIVFDAIRCRQSYAHLGGGETGRGLILGKLRSEEIDPATLFTGEGYAPAALNEAELVHPAPLEGQPAPVRLDCPDWIYPELEAAFGTQTNDILHLMQSRAAIFLRVNAKVTTRDAAISALAQDGITAHPHPLTLFALEVTENARRTTSSLAYQNGSVELQDAASQAVVDAIEVPEQGRILDFCAGGGGKTLALGAATKAAQIFAHDANPRRMQDLPARAERAGLTVHLSATAALSNQAPFDLVFCDVPCSGSGAWRRVPAGKWMFAPDNLTHLVEMQRDILYQAAPLVRPGGVLAYATCSLLRAENHDQVDHFLARNPDFLLTVQRQFTPLEGGDGMYIASMRRK